VDFSIAVNGTLMRGLELNPRMLAVGGRFDREPPGLCIGKVQLADGEETLGVLGEPALCEGQREITRYGGWRAYIAARAAGC
jgi:hypothetical protein